MDQWLQANGVDGATGAYLVPARSVEEVAAMALGRSDDPALADLRLRRALSEAHYGLRRGFDPQDLGDAGWGVVFVQDADPAVREALAPLLALRREQACVRRPRYREFAGERGYRPGLEKDRFLAENDSAPGPADPDRVPYYLLLVGDPEAIPYAFQYQLDVQYAVGRVAFERPEQYAHYAASVVAAERGALTRARRAVFFGVRNDGDAATALSAEHLAAPLAAALAERYAPAWRVDAVLGDAATKPRLAGLVDGQDAPALLFTASHGVAFPADDPRHAVHQGALLCREWPGPAHSGALTPNWYYSADDAGSAAGAAGLVGVHFACYGAGTPRLDDFSHGADAPATPIARRATVAPLARALLGHPRGAALAFVGHVERAWAWSFLWPGAEHAQRAVFEDALFALFDGARIGHAMEAFNERYAELATDLTTMLEGVRNGRRRDDLALARLWTAHSDARNYVIVGDPAVRLAVAEPPA